jgi:hypothetical protein
MLYCLCLFSLSVLAQPAALSAARTDQEEQKQKREQEAEQMALAMLDELVENGRSFRLPENRWLVLSNAADLLWRYDEKRARELFSEAMNILSQLVRQPEDDPGVFPENLRWQLASMHQQMVQMLANHDPELANDFLVSTRPNADRQRGARNADNETQLEMALVQQIASKNPRRALQRAEEILAAGKPPQLVSGILHTLREKDFDAAQKLASLIIARLLAEDQLGYDSAYFALNLATMAPPPNENVAGAKQKYLPDHQ